MEATSNMKTLHQKINELNELGFAIKFEPSTFEQMGNNVTMKIRYHRQGSSVVVENSKHLIHSHYMNEPFLVTVIDEALKEMEQERISNF